MLPRLLSSSWSQGLSFQSAAMSTDPDFNGPALANEETEERPSSLYWVTPCTIETVRDSWEEQFQAVYVCQ